MATTAQEQKDYYTARIARRMQALGFDGKTCGHCGAVGYVEFDHLRPDTRNGDFSQILRTGSDAAVTREASLVWQLCRPCHQAKVSTYLVNGEVVTVRDSGVRRDSSAKKDGLWFGFFIDRPELEPAEDREVTTILHRIVSRLEEVQARAELAMTWGR